MKKRKIFFLKGKSPSLHARLRKASCLQEKSQIQTEEKWLQHTLKFDFGLSSGTWYVSEPTGQIQCVLNCRAQEDEYEHWRTSMEEGLTGGPTSVHQSSEPPCRVCSRQHQWRNGKNMHFSLGFQILLNFQRSLWFLLRDWILFHMLHCEHFWMPHYLR